MSRIGMIDQAMVKAGWPAASAGRCKACDQLEDLRSGTCFDCAHAAEGAAARRSVAGHLLRAVGNLALLRFHFGTWTYFSWAWERLTRTGDYAPAGVFEREHGVRL